MLQFHARLTARRKAPALLWRLVSENAWQYRGRYAVAIVLMLVAAAMGSALALTIEKVMDEIFIAKNGAMIPVVAGWILAIFVIRGLAMYGQAVLLARIGNQIVAGLQSRLYTHILHQGLGFQKTQTAGDLTTRITHNANAARTALNLLATRLGSDLLGVLAYLGVMLYQDATMTAIALIGMPIAVGGVAWLVNKVRRLAKGEIDMYAKIISAMSETVMGAQVIRAFTLEDQMHRRMQAAIEGVRLRANKIAVFNGLVNPLMETLAGLAAMAVIMIGGMRVVNSGMEAGTFLSFMAAMLLAADPARRLAQLNVALKQHMAGVEYIYATLDTQTPLPVAPNARPLILSAGDIVFEDVHFSYETQPALSGFSLHARAGEVTALVGPSGAGKSTVLALMERFYDPARGRILIDGQDIRTLDPASLRQSMALVGQETFLFDVSIAQNIGFGRPQAGQEDIIAAARAANAHDFIMAMEQGYDTLVGAGGARLSGGQRQRIAIARAMLRDAPILLLDEATSALDAQTEWRVQQALERLMIGRTTLVIAHRLATVRRAQKIAVLERGHICEQGTHESLIAHDGLYAKLAALQFVDAPSQSGNGASQ